MLCLFVGEDSTSPGLPLLALTLMLTDSDLLAPSASWHRSTPGRIGPNVSWPDGASPQTLPLVATERISENMAVHSSFVEVYLEDKSVQVFSCQFG